MMKIPIKMNKISALQKSDIEMLGELYFPWTTKGETVVKWKKYFEEQEKGVRICLLVKRQEKIIAYGNLILHSEYPPFRSSQTPEISDIWVFEGYRKQGVGTFLISHLEAMAKKQGYSQIGIGVGLYRDYGSAQRLYVELGYRPDGAGITYQRNFVVPGEKYPVDDELILWLVKTFTSHGTSQK